MTTQYMALKYDMKSLTVKIKLKHHSMKFTMLLENKRNKTGQRPKAPYEVSKTEIKIVLQTQ
ncbi:hypothetical protein AABD41_00050 [Staphylococcus pseudoxylosus]